MSRTLILFAKEPRPGQVKTRLSPPLAPEEAAALARAFIEDIAAALGRVACERRVLACAPPGAEAALARLAGEGFTCEPQAEGDLGARLEAACERAFAAGAARVVVVGADSPTLPPRLVDEAFEALRAKDVVLGPALDMGYYLVGLRRPAPALFQGIPWSTREVLPSTLAVAARAGLVLHFLPPWFDVDTPADLEFLRVQVEALRQSGDPAWPRATAAVLDRLPPHYR
jgi:rSAM/selenodomain-associated transferase 1